MAKNKGWNDWYGIARKRIGPGLKRMRAMDRDAWLHQMGLERRNVGADIAGALGFTLLGCAIGIGLGVMFAPRRGEELRRQVTDKVRSYTQKTGTETRPEAGWQS